MRLTKEQIKRRREEFLLVFLEHKKKYGSRLRYVDVIKQLGLSQLGPATFKSLGYNGFSDLRVAYGLTPKALYRPGVYTKEFLKQCLMDVEEKYPLCPHSKFVEEVGCNSSILKREFGSYNNLRLSCGLAVRKASGGHRIKE